MAKRSDNFVLNRHEKIEVALVKLERAYRDDEWPERREYLLSRGRLKQYMAAKRELVKLMGYKEAP